MILKPTWHEVDRGASVLTVMMLKDHEPAPYDYIVGVVQGGLFPALIISGLFDKPMIPAGVSPPEKDIDPNLVQLPSIYGPVISGTGLRDKLPRLLIVGHETSYEMNRVIQHYLTEGHPITTAAVYHRLDSPGLKPDYFWKELSSDDKVHYPWET